MVLLRVPYEMKAGDAATVGGLPPSAFMLAVPGGANSAAAPASPARSASARRLPDSTTGRKKKREPMRGHNGAVVATNGSRPF